MFLYNREYMSQTTKLFLVGIICFLFGAGAFFSWSAYSKTQQENAQLKAKLETTASPEGIPSNTNEKKMVAPSPTPEDQIDEKTPVIEVGSITGTTGYPSEGIPPLEIYAFKASDHSIYFKTTTQTNQQSFTIDAVTPGSYVVVAYPASNGGLTGGYTKAVSCGLSVECTDHSLIEVDVVAGKTKSGVEIKDWYAPAGQFPSKP